MQEFNENDDFPKEEENQEEKLTKEQILSRSRKENKKGDEREKQVAKTGSIVMGITLILCVGVFFIVERIVTRQYRFDYMFMMCFTMMVGCIYNAIKFKKKTDVILAILAGVYSAFFITLYVLSLCGKI